MLAQLRAAPVRHHPASASCRVSSFAQARHRQLASEQIASRHVLRLLFISHVALVYVLRSSRRKRHRKNNECTFQRENGKLERRTVKDAEEESRQRDEAPRPPRLAAGIRFVCFESVCEEWCECGWDAGNSDAAALAMRTGLPVRPRLHTRAVHPQPVSNQRPSPPSPRIEVCAIRGDTGSSGGGTGHRRRRNGRRHQWRGGGSREGAAARGGETKKRGCVELRRKRRNSCGERNERRMRREEKQKKEKEAERLRRIGDGDRSSGVERSGTLGASLHGSRLVVLIVACFWFCSLRLLGTGLVRLNEDVGHPGTARQKHQHASATAQQSRVPTGRAF